MAAKKLKPDFDFLKHLDGVLGVLLFGSKAAAKNKKAGRDSDVCIVAPGSRCNAIMTEVYKRIDTGKQKYDVYCFEELPLYMRWEVLLNHRVIWARDNGELYEYLYYFRKLYEEQKHRMRLSKKEIREVLNAQVAKARKK